MYPKYKDSGEQWLGQIPEHWEMRQWRFLLKENVTPNTDCKETQQLQFKYGEIIPKANQEIDSDTLKIICKYNKVQPNDIMINGLNLNYDFISQRIGMVQTNGIITSAYISLRPIGSANPSYYNYLLKAMDAQKMFHGMGTGVRLTLSYKELKSKYLPFPTEAEQEAMVAYLDEQTGKIDAAIEREQKMIDLLNERKQIIIQQAVTKGLNPNAPLKDSGVIGGYEIPSHWKITKTLYALSMPITDGPHETPELYEDGIPFVSAEAVSCGNGRIDFDHIRGYISEAFYKECCKKYTPALNDIYMIKSGATTGKVAIVDTDRIFTIWSPLAVFRCNAKVMYYKYLFFLLQSNFYQKQVQLGWSYGTQQNIGMRTLEKLRILLPPIEEQKAIVDYISSAVEPINKAIEAKNRVITLLQERKQIIINEVVTGKIKVS